ncbi:MAG: hypothetical protein M3N91_02745 [Pseudomonadota bacterium]|nr:hypothetical protein [Pseudomonadota bacterium]
MLSMAKCLRYSANFAMAASLVKLVAGDLAAEVGRDVRTLPGRTRHLVRRSPYGVAGAATAMGFVAGMLLVKRHRRG